MKFVVFDLKTTPKTTPNMAEIIAISAIKMTAGRWYMYDRQPFETFVQCKSPLPGWGKDADLEQAPSQADALLNFSRFVGDACLIADAGPVFKMPFIHQACAGPGQATREVRVLDSTDLARMLWPDAVFQRLDDFANRLKLPSVLKEDGMPQLSRNVERLVEAVDQMRCRLSPRLMVWPVGSCMGLLPALDDDPSIKARGSSPWLF